MTTAIFFGATVALVVWALVRQWRHEGRSAAVLADAAASGLTEPASLHPQIDEARCIGCAACVEACPEKEILGLVDGKARLIGPTNCIGHGACRSSCPSEAIRLVFGTEERGVDIPLLADNFETNVPGIFIAGELGGMGLIRNAFEQGRQAVEAVQRLEGIGRDAQRLDLVIVGAGPSGLAAALTARDRGLNFAVLEQESLGGAVAHYPRGKIVMTRPASLPIVGKVRFTETTKEELLEFFRNAEARGRLEIRYGERVENVEKNGDAGFVVRSTGGSYETRAVLLTIGRRGTPRKLGVEGEQLEKVTYRLLDPEQFGNRHVLVVGGGDSALEAATTLADQPGTRVTLSYRSPAFNRAKPANRKRVEDSAAGGRLTVLLQSQVQAIHPESVDLLHEGRVVSLRNDDVIVCAGGVLPTPFLKQMGIAVETKHGEQ